MKQLSLLQHSVSHGGDLLKNKQKTRRPLSSRRPVHVVFRSQKVMDHGSFVRHKDLLNELLQKYARMYHITIYEFAICTNHLHGVFGFKECIDFQNFLRSFTGQVAQKISNQKGFWEARPFTRVLSWGKDFERTQNYVEKNRLETWGWIEYQPRC